MSRATRASKKDGEKAKEADLACDLCDGLFKGTEEVLYCEGSCRKHMHRYCAGVSKYHYLEMKNSSTLFCTQRLHKAEVQGLQSVIAALKDKLSQLRAFLLSLVKQAAPASCAASPCTEDALKALRKDTEKLQSTVSNQQVASYANVVGSGSLRETKSKGNGTSKPNQASKTIPEPGSQVGQLKPQSSKPCVVEKGARKVWGTLRSTTVSAVTGAIRSVTNISTNDLSVK